MDYVSDRKDRGYPSSMEQIERQSLSEWKAGVVENLDEWGEILRGLENFVW